ncbi:hypothetical protein BV210_00155 [Halorientalis sp. IM1011]|uniref:hypothetical protein n=1 Tax=Halorientalis sp. IM1011 TaxID=1932360 RepID=UPI00097CC430|nr:hypothetical protein [Halorientalis sp. IM1011]AQL41217.1 hypothetical protein BV210_00155 [Halorientalis sp. IM1011]
MQQMADEIIRNARSLDPQSDDRFETENHHDVPITATTIQTFLFAGKRRSVRRQRDGRTLSVTVEHSIWFSDDIEGFVQFHIKGDIETKDVKSVDVVSAREEKR